jgi:carboxymethylenebutenolidase
VPACAGLHPMAEPVPASPHRATPGPPWAEWVTIDPAGPGEVALRCWWARPAEGDPRAGVLVLPEVFGVNGWVRSVAGRLAAEGYAALAVPLFTRTAPGLELGYDDAALSEGRAHKDRTTVPQLLTDVAAAALWLQATMVGLSRAEPRSEAETQSEGGAEAGGVARARTGREGRGLGCVGFCFGGHVALLAATLAPIEATCDFYGAGVASGRPGGGPPSLELVPQIGGRLLCLCGTADGLIPPSDVTAIAAALQAANQQRQASAHGAAAPGPHRLITLEGGHGFMCEARADHRPEAAAQGWRAMLEWFSENL